MTAHVWMSAVYGDYRIGLKTNVLEKHSGRGWVAAAGPGASDHQDRGLSRRIMTGGLALLAGATLAGCAIHKTTWTEKLTVVVTTPHGEVSGSAIRWQSLSEDPVLNLAHSDMRGEAVVVEVARGRYLFALVEDNRPQAELMFFPGEPPVDAAPKLRRVKGQARAVPRSMYPLLVTFDDLKVPASVKQVDPDNLAAAFGDGYALKSITLEITDAPVTQGRVEAVLPWLGDPAVMENPNWRKIPLAARELLGGFLLDYRAAQERFLKEHRQ